MDQIYASISLFLDLAQAAEKKESDCRDQNAQIRILSRFFPSTYKDFCQIARLIARQKKASKLENPEVLSKSVELECITGAVKESRD